MLDDCEPHARVGVALVRNDARHDARVAREVGVMRRLGLAPVVVAVVSGEVPERHGTLGGARVLRLAPRSLAARVRARRLSSGTVAPAAGLAEAAPPGARSTGPLVRLNRTLTSIDFHRQALGAVRALRPALLHCNDHNTMWTGVVSKLAFGTPVLYDAHELWPDRNGRWEWRPWLLAAEAMFVRAADVVITASPGYAEAMSERYRVSAPLVVRNVPDARPSPARPQRAAWPAVVYAGGLMRGRGLEAAIRALAQAPETVLTLIGPGHAAYVERLRALAGELGVADRLQVERPVPPDELIDRLAAFDVGLSLIEPICRSYELTLPNKLFEYLAAGLPVISSDVPTMAAFVRGNGVGAVVSPADPLAVAAAMVALADPDRSATARGRVHALAGELTWKHEGQRLADAYELARDVAAGRRPSAGGIRDRQVDAPA